MKVKCGRRFDKNMGVVVYWQKAIKSMSKHGCYACNPPCIRAVTVLMSQLGELGTFVYLEWELQVKLEPVHGPPFCFNMSV